MPVFPIRLILMILPVVVVGLVVGVIFAKGGSGLRKQGVAWFLTALMIVAAIGIGYGRANASRTPENVSAPTNAPTVPPQAYPALSYVRDGAGVLSGQTEQVLDERNERLWNNYNVTVGVVTCNYNRDDLYDYTVKQFEDMGLGGSDMLVVLDISGDNYGLYAGSGVSRHFSDQDCSDYAYDYMEEWFAAGDYDFAVCQLTEMLELWYGTYYG